MNQKIIERFNRLHLDPDLTQIVNEELSYSYESDYRQPDTYLTDRDVVLIADVDLYEKPEPDQEENAWANLTQYLVVMFEGMLFRIDKGHSSYGGNSWSDWYPVAETIVELKRYVKLTD